VVERWHQLPRDHALTRMPVVRELVQQLADTVADAEDRPRVDVPDLGPAVVMDQLRVMVQDAMRLGGGAATHTLADRLRTLRSALR